MTTWDDMEGSWTQKQTPEDLKRLAQLHTLPHWGPLRQIILRLGARFAGNLDQPDAPLERMRYGQGGMAFARELLTYLEEQAPRDYQRRQREAEEDQDEGP